MQAWPYRQQRTDAAVERSMELHQYPASAESILPILQDVQQECSGISPTSIGCLSDQLGVPDAQTFGVASFYSMLSMEKQPQNVLRICDGPACALAGGAEARQRAEAHADADTLVVRTSCLGLCDRAPAALLNHAPCGPLVESTKYDLAASLTYGDARPGETRIVMRRIGKVDPDSIQDAVGSGGYEAARATPAEILQAIETSGLRGCGGAGFPTGRKWRMVADQAADEKYVICNADESEPLTFKDRVLMEGDPHLLLEGMLVAGLAVGATNGVIYIRGEYECAARRLERAIEQAEQRGFLGENVMGSAQAFHIHVHRGAGAYICGEETALLESLEGRRGEPRLRPPYPTVSGFRGCPTIVNNVETLCQIPGIITHGSEPFRAYGTADSPGTKLFCITGHIQQPGVVELPFGVTLRQLIHDFAGGMREGTTFKAALVGGAAGTVVGESALDVPLDFDSHRKGVALGSGGIMIMDGSVSIVEVLIWLLRFFEVESCGKCTPCREGSREVRERVEEVLSTGATPAQLNRLHRLANLLKQTSFCGLGQSIALPIDSALADFPEEFGVPAG